MSEMIPENMREIRLKMMDLNDQGEKVNEDDLIAKTVVDIFQSYIDSAEEGHYDTCKLIDDFTFQIIDILGHPGQKYQSGAMPFVEQFKQNPQTLLLKLEDWASKVAID